VDPLSNEFADGLPAQKFKRLRRIEGFNHARALNWSCFRNQPFLRSDRAGQWVVDAIIRAQIKHRFAVWAWCVMPSHVHMLIFPDPETRPAVASILRSIKLPVAQGAIAWAQRHSPASLARMEDRRPCGDVSYRFWQRGGGYDRNMTSDRTIWKVIDYIHANPVEEGLCERPEDWAWSSAVTFQDRTVGRFLCVGMHCRGAGEW
jgi:putative transposase